MVRDPVCRMELDPLQAPHRVEGSRVDQEGLAFYFCSPMCHTLFLENPHKYLQPGGGIPMEEVSRRTARAWLISIAGVLLGILLVVIAISTGR